MPDLDGVEVTRRLRSADRHLPIFVLTGHADVATAIEALKAGATEYLTKPVNIDELTTLLTRALAERPLLEEGADRKSTRLNSSHVRISYAVFCLTKKTKPALLDTEMHR